MSSESIQLPTCLIIQICWNNNKMIISRIHTVMQLKKVQSLPFIGLMLYFDTLFLQIIRHTVFSFFLSWSLNIGMAYTHLATDFIPQKITSMISIQPIKEKAAVNGGLKFCPSVKTLRLTQIKCRNFLRTSNAFHM